MRNRAAKGRENQAEEDEEDCPRGLAVAGRMGAPPEHGYPLSRKGSAAAHLSAGNR